MRVAAGVVEKSLIARAAVWRSKMMAEDIADGVMGHRVR